VRCLRQYAYRTIARADTCTPQENIVVNNIIYIIGAIVVIIVVLKVLGLY
jgi:hypothetical protein